MAILIENNLLMVCQAEHPVVETEKVRTILNVSDVPLANGIVMCNVPGANELIMNQHAQDDPQLIVANEGMIEIFQASRTLDEGVPKISLVRLFLIGK